MIKTKKQYKSVQHLLKNAERALKICEMGTWTDDVQYKSITDCLKSQISNLKKAIRIYRSEDDSNLSNTIIDAEPVTGKEK